MIRTPISLKAQKFAESVIREMTRLAIEHGAINLAQGFPDFPAPDEVKKPQPAPFAPTSINMQSPGERRGFDGRLLNGSSVIRACPLIPNARSQSAAAPPRP